MSNRKLQQEFDKTNKKILEGLTLFDDVYEKALTTELSSQRDKFEADLKKEIKKLQRLRDQLKQWLGDTTIKLDKNLLSDNRGKIENAMDRFKDLEKLSKIKQFSNEGLELSSKKKLPRFGDANEEKKQEAVDYISDIRDQIAGQNELLESDLHHYTTQLKKAKANTYNLNNQIEDCKTKIDRNIFHLTQLEMILRNLENEELKPDMVDLIKEDLEYYVENNQDDEFVEYDEFYEQLELNDDHEVQGVLLREKEEQEEREKEEEELKKEEERKKEEEKKKQDEKVKKEKEEIEKKKEPIVSNVPAATKPVTNSVPPPPMLPPGTSYSSAVKSAIENQNVYTTGTTMAEAVSSSIASPRPAYPGLNDVNGINNSKSAINTPSVLHAAMNNSSSNLNGTSNNTPSKVSAPPPGLSTTLTKSSTSSPVPSKAVLQDLANNGTFITTIPKLSQIGQIRLNNPLPYKSIRSLLENSLYNCPDSFDADKPREYNPINVHPSSIDYPHEPMHELNSFNLMSKFDNDTLFYCFYYSGDNLSKYNASKELSKRGWIYDVDSKQWLLNDEKSNDLKYFDYEKTWLIRRKENFQINQDSILSFI